MRYEKGKTIKVIEETEPKQFETKLNEALKSFDKIGAKYELMFNMNKGHCAYIVAEYKRVIVETAKDEHDIRGDLHICGECPLWIHPTKGNVKYTRCDIVGYKVGIHDGCCEQFYEMLDRGEIKLNTEE